MSTLKDKHGNSIQAGDWVSLGSVITADNSLGFEPSGFVFNEDDFYEVYFDERINKWSLKMGVEPDSRSNIKLLNHALTILHSGEVEIVQHYPKALNP